MAITGEMRTFSPGGTMIRMRVNIERAAEWIMSEPDREGAPSFLLIPYRKFEGWARD
jgi:hypothetical protein